MQQQAENLEINNQVSSFIKQTNIYKTSCQITLMQILLNSSCCESNRIKLPSLFSVEIIFN